jgi:hypothetical protein
MRVECESSGRLGAAIDLEPYLRRRDWSPARTSVRMSMDEVENVTAGRRVGSKVVRRNDRAPRSDWGNRERLLASENRIRIMEE